MLCEKLMKYPVTKTIKGRFTYVESNCYLYFNRKDDNELEKQCIYSCLEELNNSYSKENNYYRNYLYLQEIDYKVGNIYAAIYSQDKKFYRVKILKLIDFEKVCVRFVDYGNSDIILKSELAPLPHQISSIKPLTILCKISNIQIVLEKAFIKLIGNICLRDLSITIEGKTIKNIANEAGSKESNTLYLINFPYHGMHIRDYLIKNKIGVKMEETYQSISLWPNDKSDIIEEPLMVSDCKNSPISDKSSSNHENPEFTKTVIITCVNSNCDIYVHDFCKDVKTKLEMLQLHINKTVDTFKSRINDNVFNKRNTYLTQFTEDLMWYRCKINNFDPSKGFLVQYIDFGNLEYKSSLSDLILLTRDMGCDGLYLIDEEPVAQLCQLSSQLKKIFPSNNNIRKYLTRTFVEPVKKVNITYSVAEEVTTVWLIKDITYHQQCLSELLEKQCVLKESSPNNRDAVSEASSHSLNNVTDIKVADYLINGCPEFQEEFFTTMDSNRQYLVTYIGGIDEIWIDIGDGQTQEMCDNLLSKINQDFSVSEVVIDYIYGIKDKKIDGSSNPVRCKILDVLDNFIRIHLIDKGHTKDVSIDEIFNLSPEILAIPQQVLKFKFPENLKLRINEESLVDHLKGLLENKYVRLVRESLQTNVLIDILIDNKSVLQRMISKKIAYILDNECLFPSSSISNQNVYVQVNTQECYLFNGYYTS